VAFERTVEDPALKVTFENEDRRVAMVASTEHDCERSGRFEAGDEALFAVRFDNYLAPGRYIPVATLVNRGGGLDVIDRYPPGLSMMVGGVNALGGYVDLPYTGTVERLTTGERTGANVS
jgi:hypothetical protein